jgi:hypothetical protein
VATTISPTNQSCATRKGASSCAGAARAALAARGRCEPCRVRSWASRGHVGRAAHEGSSATLRTRAEPTREAAAGLCEGASGHHAGRPRWLSTARAGREPRRLRAAGCAGCVPRWPRRPRRGTRWPRHRGTPGWP